MGRYSIIGLPCQTLLKVHNRKVSIEKQGAVIEELETEDPLEFIEQFQGRYQVAEDENLPRFTGGLVGYFGYDTIRYIEPKLANCPNPDHIGNPDIMLMVSDEVVVFDNLSGSMYVIVHADPTQGGSLKSAEARIQELIAKMQGQHRDQSAENPGR